MLAGQGVFEVELDDSVSNAGHLPFGVWRRIPLLSISKPDQ
jgi:hypothetical protein